MKNEFLVGMLQRLAAPLEELEAAVETQPPCFPECTPDKALMAHSAAPGRHKSGKHDSQPWLAWLDWSHRSEDLIHKASYFPAGREEAEQALSAINQRDVVRFSSADFERSARD